MKLVIDEVEYNIPDRLNLKKWSVLSNWSFIETNYDMLIHHSIGIPLKDCERIPLDTKMLAVSIISVLMYPNCEGLKLKLNLNNLTFGDFVDMEIYAGKGIHKNLDKVVPLLFGVEYSDEMFINDIWDGLNKYFTFRISIFNRYKKLFDADDEPVVEEEKNRIPLEYIWWEILMILCDGKFLNIDEAVKKPLISALNYISWNKDKNTREINRQKSLRNEL